MKINGLTVFIIPNNTLPSEPLLRDIFNRAGYELLERLDNVSKISLDIFRQKTLSAIFAVDIMPLPSQREVENPRIFNVQHILRKTCDRRSIIAASTTPLAEKLAHKLLTEERRRQLFEKCRVRAMEYETREEVATILCNGMYNKVEIIRQNGERFVRKTFRHWQVACLQREIAARQGLADVAEISPITDSGKFYISVPYYHAVYSWNSNKIAPYCADRARIVFTVLQKIWAAGWAQIDCHPGNFIFIDKDKVKVVDMEYARPCKSPMTTFEESWDMAGPPDAIFNEMPLAPKSSYRNVWLPAIGLSYAQLIDPARHGNEKWRQYFFRTLLCSRRLIHRNLRRQIIASRQKSVAISDGWVYLPLKKRYR